MSLRIINVQIIENVKTGLLIGISEEMKGLYVHGHTEAELESRIPDAIKALLEAEGRTDISVQPVQSEEQPKLPPSFSRSRSVRQFAFSMAA